MSVCVSAADRQRDRSPPREISAEVPARGDGQGARVTRAGRPPAPPCHPGRGRSGEQGHLQAARSANIPLSFPFPVRTSRRTELGLCFFSPSFKKKKKKKTGKGGAAAVPGRGPAASSGPACLRSRHPRAKDGCGPSELASRAVAASRPESRVLPDSHFHPRSRRPGPRAGSFKPPPRPPRPRLSPAPRGTRRVTAPLA